MRRGSGPFTTHATSPRESASAQFSDGPAQRSSAATPSATFAAKLNSITARLRPSSSSQVAWSASGLPCPSRATTGPQRVLSTSSRSGSLPATAIANVSLRNGSLPSVVT